MYQNQFVSLTEKLQQEMASSVPLSQLLNDDDKRRRLLDRAMKSEKSNLQCLARRITIIEDMVSYRIRIDIVPAKVKKVNKWRRSVALMCFALSNVGIIAGSVIVFEDIKYSRLQAQGTTEKK